MRYRTMPRTLDLTSAPEKLAPTQAAKLQRVDLRSAKKVVGRGKGYTRVDFTTGEATTVSAAGVLRRRDGTAILIFSTTAGVWKAAVRPSMAFTDASF